MTRVLPDGEGSVRLEADGPDTPLQVAQLRVRMLRAPINPADRMMIDGAYALPHEGTLGAEGVGEVIAIGAGVSDLSPGDRVLPLSRGNWTRIRTLGRTEVVTVPRGLPLHAAAALRINPATAARLLQQGAPARGDWILQNAARSSVALWVRRLSRAQGLRTIDVVRTPGGLEAGGTVLVEDETLHLGVRDVTGGEPVKLALDCVAGCSTGRLAQALADRGRLIVFGHLSNAPCSVPSKLLTGRGLRLEGFSLRPAEMEDTPAGLQTLYDDLAALAGEGFMPEPDAVFPLTSIAEALSSARAGLRVQLDLT